MQLFIENNDMQRLKLSVKHNYIVEQHEIYVI